MTHFIGALSLFMVIAFSPEAHSTPPSADKNVIQQLDMATYVGALKEYRKAVMKARADVKIARAEYLTAKKSADSAEAKADAFAKFRLARALSWDLVPKRPVRPTN